MNPTNGWDFAKDAVAMIVILGLALAFLTDFWDNIGRRRK